MSILHHAADHPRCRGLAHRAPDQPARADDAPARDPAVAGRRAANERDWRHPGRHAQDGGVPQIPDDGAVAPEDERRAGAVRREAGNGGMMTSRPRVLVADDHRAVLDSLVRLLSSEFEIVATVTDGLSAVTTAARLQPDLLVLDIAMPGLNGLAAAARLKESGSAAKVVFVTNLHDREFVQESLALGNVGFVVKDRLVADLLPALRAVLAGQSFVSPSVAC